MGLFDKKYCDICGEKIGLLGNRKLEDGNMCKDCAKLLSPLFEERRQSSIDEIKAQLQYRKENETDVENFNPSRSFGRDGELKIDDNSGTFIYCKRNNWQELNPDVINISQVLSCTLDIREEKKELYREDSEGKRVSYNPRRYKTLYEFFVDIKINSPYFDEINMRLDDPFKEIDSRYDHDYKRYEEVGEGICKALDPAFREEKVASAPVINTASPVETAKNTAKFCECCGSQTAPDESGNCPFCTAPMS